MLFHSNPKDTPAFNLKTSVLGRAVKNRGN